MAGETYAHIYARALSPPPHTPRPAPAIIAASFSCLREQHYRVLSRSYKHWRRAAVVRCVRCNLFLLSSGANEKSHDSPSLCSTSALPFPSSLFSFRFLIETLLSLSLSLCVCVSVYLSICQPDIPKRRLSESIGRRASCSKNRRPILLARFGAYRPCTTCSKYLGNCEGQRFCKERTFATKNNILVIASWSEIGKIFP
jgi:hypothetical protein